MLGKMGAGEEGAELCIVKWSVAVLDYILYALFALAIIFLIVLIIKVAMQKNENQQIVVYKKEGLNTLFLLSFIFFYVS